MYLIKNKFLKSNKKRKQKAISSIITVVLLVLVATIIVTIILNWGKATTKETLDSITKQYRSLDEIECSNLDLKISNFKIDEITKDINFTIENKGNININGIILTVLGTTYDGNLTKLEGIFDNVGIKGGDIKNLTTSSPIFIYTTNKDINYFDTNSINDIIISTPTCPSKNYYIKDYNVFNSLDNNLVFSLDNDNITEVLGDEELENTTFDSNLDNWTVLTQGSSSVTYDSKIYHNNKGSLKIDIIDDWAQADQTFNVQPNRKYRLSFNYYSTSDGNTTYRIKDDSSNLSYNPISKTWQAGDYWISVNGSQGVWNYEELDFFNNSSASTLKLTLYYNTGNYNTTYYYDDVSLKAIDLNSNNTIIRNYGVDSVKLPNNSYRSSFFKGNTKRLKFDNISFDENDSWSVSMWANPSSKDLEDFMFALGDGYNGGSGLVFRDSGVNRTAFRLNGDYYLVNTINPNEYHHYTYTTDSNIISLYIDGIFLGSQDVGNSSITFNNIGSAYNEVTLSYKGELSDLQIYNKKLNNYDINYLYNSTKNKYESSIPYYQDIMFFIDANTLSKSHNNLDYVTYIEDLSLMNNYAYQDNITYYPLFVEDSINGLPAIRFSENTEAFLETINNTGLSGQDFDISVFSVVKLNTTPPSCSTIISQNVGQFKKSLSIGTYGHKSGKLATDHWNAAGNYGSTLLSLDTPYLLETIIPNWGTNNVDTRLYVNGNRESESSYGDWDPPDDLTDKPFRIGNWAVTSRDDMIFTGDIAEIIVYNRELNDQEREDVENYLKTKYNIN
jgi:hypothetical protein